MLKVHKPRNARSKRAMEAREPKVVEDVKTALFVKSSSTSANVNTALAQLLLLKKPDAISFTKKTNTGIRPFEDAASLEFWSSKNDTAFAILGSHSKKRPNNLTFTRMFAHQTLDMFEVGVEAAKAMTEFTSRKPSVGQKPLFVFSGDLFSTHPFYIQFKSMILDLYRGELASNINLQGLEHVISITHAPDSSPLISTSEPLSIVPTASSSTSSATPVIHFRTYLIKLLKSSSGKTPFINLEQCGPSFDFSPRRSNTGSEEQWKAATKTLKRKTKGEGGAQAKKRSKNWDTDEMGDKVGRIHVGVQDLSKMQTRKMKGLKSDRKEGITTSSAAEESDGGVSDIEMESVAGDGISD